MFSEKVVCICSHVYQDHALIICGYCKCAKYDANGHNPEQKNFLCPQCSLTWMNLLDNKTYFCYACSYIMFEWQVRKLVG